MNLLDLIIIIIFLIGFILGFKDGFVRKIIGLAGLILGIYLAVFFAERFGGMIETAFGLENYLAVIVAGIAIFLVIVLIFSILKRLIHPFDKVNNLVNQLIGGVIGALQILFFASAVLFLLNIFSVPKKDIKESSLLYSYVYNIIPSTVELISDYTPYASDNTPANNSKKVSK